MRLTALLAMWPKKRPNGNIFNGTNKMVRKTESWHLNALSKDVEREQKNIQVLLRPFLSPAEERRSAPARQGALRPDQILFRMRKAKAEQTVMAPTFAEDNVKHLLHNVMWEESR